MYMLRIMLFAIFQVGMVFHFAYCQLTIQVTSIPATTPPGSSIFIAGNFNGWDPGNPAYQLTDLQNGTYSITFTPSPGTLEFKFTRGSWETVEGTSAGGYIPNRSYTYNGGTANTSLTIAGWEDGGSAHTAAENVTVLDEAFLIPQLNRTRRIWIYLPPDYATSSKHYPVIYMQDGQNLFDAYYSFAGEWKVDESMNTLFDADDYGAIVVGIDNGGSERINEYSPFYNPGYGGGEGEAYASFIVQTLKPHIDSTFRTLPGREYTAIAGSSMGANISMFAIAEYPEVFSKAGIFSPAFWFSDSTFLQVASKTFTAQLRVYFVAGQNESQTMIPKMMEMYDLLLSEGMDESNLHFVNEADGAHSEWFWAREYPDAYEWLFDGLVLQSNPALQKKTEIFPNPAVNSLSISTEALGGMYAIYSSLGQLMLKGTIAGDRIDISSLAPGLYVFQIVHPLHQKTGSARFIKL